MIHCRVVITGKLEDTLPALIAIGLNVTNKAQMSGRAFVWGTVASDAQVTALRAVPNVVAVTSAS